MLTALVLSACTATPEPDDSPAPSPPSPAPSSTAPVDPASTSTPATSPPTPALRPGDPCDPADGSPDCTDATADGQFRYVEGYADCVATFGEEQAYGLCTDLDGDGIAGYPDAG